MITNEDKKRADEWVVEMEAIRTSYKRRRWLNIALIGVVAATMYWQILFNCQLTILGIITMTVLNCLWGTIGGMIAVHQLLKGIEVRVMINDNDESLIADIKKK